MTGSGFDPQPPPAAFEEQSLTRDAQQARSLLDAAVRPLERAPDDRPLEDLDRGGERLIQAHADLRAIRQLANEVRRMIALAEPGATLTPALLSNEARASRRTMPAADGPAEPRLWSPGSLESLPSSRVSTILRFGGLVARTAFVEGNRDPQDIDRAKV